MTAASPRRRERTALHGAILLAVLAPSLVPKRARAQSSPNGVIAEQLFREGERLFKAGKTHEACEKFAASNKLDPAPGTLNNLALCHEKEGKTASAWLEQSELAGLAARAGKRDREQAARAKAAALGRLLPKARVHVPETVTLASVALDGAPLNMAALGEPFPIDPGAHSIRALDDRQRVVTIDFVVPTGPGTTAVVLTFASALPVLSPIATADVLQPAPSGSSTLGWAFIGVGAAGVAAGAVFGLLANAHKNDHPNDSAFTFATASDVTAIVGVAAVATGIYFVLRPPNGPPSPTVASSARGTWPDLTVSPVLSPTGGQLRLGGAF
jgi:hypothetical protein